MRNGTEIPEPKADKSLAYNFLWLLNGAPPDDYAVRTFDAVLILHADHELNASTFSARVTAATLSDLHSAVTSAICTLKGPLHGGANEAVMQMLQEIGELENVAPYMERLRADGKKVMGFGHRVYKAKDPRAIILEKMSEELGKRAGDTKWFEMTRAVEEIFQPQVAAKGIYPNVDFYSVWPIKSWAFRATFLPRFSPVRASWAGRRICSNNTPITACSALRAIISARRGANGRRWSRAEKRDKKADATRHPLFYQVHNCGSMRSPSMVSIPQPKYGPKRLSVGEPGLKNRISRP